MVFALGFAAGGLVTPLLVKNPYRSVSASKSTSPGLKKGRVDAMAEELGLDPEKKEQLRQIVSKSRDCYRELNKEYSPRCDWIRNQTRAEIIQILDDEQKRRFQRHIERKDRERQEDLDRSTQGKD
ncbi:MAG: hypothetical protein HY232_05860 [Acidobacteria bacterium]|nr:hypothetical protein [Acidobacteriota bacterium]